MLSTIIRMDCGRAKPAVSSVKRGSQMRSICGPTFHDASAGRNCCINALSLVCIEYAEGLWLLHTVYVSMTYYRMADLHLVSHPTSQRIDVLSCFVTQMTTDEAIECSSLLKGPRGISIHFPAPKPSFAPQKNVALAEENTL